MTALPGPSPRVLVLDNNEDHRYLIGEMLANEGIEVVRCARSAEALNYLQGAAADVILCDVHPSGGNGWEFLERYRGLATTPAPVIALSTAFGLAEEAAAHLVDDYLSKPFDLEDLLAMVLKHFPSPKSTAG